MLASFCGSSTLKSSSGWRNDLSRRRVSTCEKRCTGHVQLAGRTLWSGALRWRRAFDAATERLLTNPSRFGRVEEADDLIQRDVRQILFKTPRGRIDRAVFVVAGSEVRILRVRGPGQPPITDDDL